MKNNKPIIRINQYFSEWKEFKMINLVTPIVREVSKPSSSYKRLSVRSHAKGTFHQVVEDPNTIAMDKLYIVHENDLIVNITFAWEHAIAVAEKKDHNLLVSHRFPTFLINKSDINFIKHLVSLNSFKNRLDLISPGGAGRNRVLNKKDFNNMKLFVPVEMEEQKKIGLFFKNLDETISLHQKELNALKQTKQGFLQKMFPEEGESVPKVRFSKYSGQWTKEDLGALVNKIRSYPLSRNVETDSYSEYKYIHYGDIHKKVAKYIDDLSYLPNIQEGNYERLEEGDLVLADASEDYQGIANAAILAIKPAQKVIAGLHTIALRPDPQRLNSLYLYYLLESSGFKKYGYKTGTGMKVFGISATNLLKFNTVYPTIEEQSKIGEFFRQLDEIIELEELELEALKQTKKGFLQKMFV